MIKVTKLGLTQLVKMARKHNTNTISFSVKGGGCNGFNYVLEPMSEKIEKGDEVVNVHNNLDVVVDRLSQFYLIGTTIDFKEDFMGDRFTFENPNAASSCGCATSFSV